jgi:outer membrane biosynthesis protein TonB
MQNKVLKLLVTFLVLFSLQGFSQTPEKSKHPLLDKYYPKKQSADTNTTVTTQTKPVPEIKPVAETKPMPEVKPIPRANQVSEAKPVPETTTVAEVKPVPAPGDTTVIDKPTNTTAPEPVQKNSQTRPASNLYSDTRLGSSSPLYDTYEKNKNGVGSVTTSPK